MMCVLIYRSTYWQIGIRAGLPLLGCQQDRTKKGQRDALALPCCIAAQRRSEPVLSEVEGLLSIALSFVEQSRFYHPLFAQNKNGLLFDNKVVPFWIIILMLFFSKWALFR